MTFEEAMELYEQHFDQSYPYAVGIGFPGKTDEENIAIIEKCIAENKPVEFNPTYRDDCDY